MLSLIAWIAGWWLLLFKHQHLNGYQTSATSWSRQYFLKLYEGFPLNTTEDLLTKKPKIQQVKKATSSVSLTEIAQARGLLCEMQLRAFSQRVNSGDEWLLLVWIGQEILRLPGRGSQHQAESERWLRGARCSLCRHTLGWIHLLSLLLSGFDRAVLVMTEQFCFRSF